MSFSPKKNRQFSQEIKVEFLDKKWRFRTVCDVWMTSLEELLTLKTSWTHISFSDPHLISNNSSIKKSTMTFAILNNLSYLCVEFRSQFWGIIGSRISLFDFWLETFWQIMIRGICCKTKTEMSVNKTKLKQQNSGKLKYEIPIFLGIFPNFLI